MLLCGSVASNGKSYCCLFSSLSSLFFFGCVESVWNGMGYDHKLDSIPTSESRPNECKTKIIKLNTSTISKQPLPRVKIFYLVS